MKQARKRPKVRLRPYTPTDNSQYHYPNTISTQNTIPMSLANAGNSQMFLVRLDFGTPKDGTDA